MRNRIAILLVVLGLFIALAGERGLPADDKTCFYCRRPIEAGQDSTDMTSLQTGKEHLFHYGCYPSDPYNAPACAICTLFTAEQNLSRANKLPLCSYCLPFSVRDEKRIGIVLDDVRYICYKEFGFATHRRPELQVLEYDEFHRRFGRTMAFANYRRDPDPSTDRVLSSIYVVRGYSLNNYYHYLSQEYGHAWQADYPRISGESREGFGEWLAYRICKMKKIDPVEYYGRCLTDVRVADSQSVRGLKMFLRVERRSGLKGVMELAAKEEE